MSESKYFYINKVKQTIQNSAEYKEWRNYLDGHIIGDLHLDDEFILQHFANELGIEIKILHR